MRILACLDRTEGDGAVFATLRRWALRSPVEVWLLHVAAEEPAFLGYDEPGGPYDRERRADELREEREWLDREAEILRAEGITASRILARGEVSSVILKEAGNHDVDAVLLGARHRSRLQRLLKGSVLRSLLDREGPAVVLAQNPGRRS